ncbi:MAG: AarF/UbiB family protein [Proteobacteria bacterium]|nr:AarF/UbiB family protein [Pseudomonadota bacterium]
MGGCMDEELRSLQNAADVASEIAVNYGFQFMAALVIPLLGGLEKVHEAGFIHRDIKPANIFIRNDGSPVLLDFGSARQALGEETKTLTSLVSPGYAPFEQYYSKSAEQGAFTDIYGLGATLYRAVTGYWVHGCDR